MVAQADSFLGHPVLAFRINVAQMSKQSSLITCVAFVIDFLSFANSVRMDAIDEVLDRDGETTSNKLLSEGISSNTFMSGHGAGSREGIRGVSVHNYHLAYTDHHAATKLEFEEKSLLNVSNRRARRSWIIYLNEAHCKDADLFCNLEGSELPHNRIHCKVGGRCWITVQCVADVFENLMEFRGDWMDFVEPDLQVSTKPVSSYFATGDALSDTSFLETSMGKGKGKGDDPWHLQRVGSATNTSKGEGVHVYVVDTGVFASHASFGGRVIPTLEMITGDDGLLARKVCARSDTECAADRDGHGTHCAGLVGSDKWGVATKSIIHAVKALGDNGRGTTSMTMAAVEWVVSNVQKPAVISMSIGGVGRSRLEQAVIDDAIRNNVIVVVAAGNEGDDACYYSPSFVESAMTVGATSRDDAVAAFSNVGPCVDIFAPGVDLFSAGIRSNDSLKMESGTSMACPLVAGAAALLLSNAPSLDPTGVRGALITHGERGSLQNIESITDTRSILLRIGQRSAVQFCPALTTFHKPVNGSCTCNAGTVCFKWHRKGCPLPSGGISMTEFVASCSSCKCIPWQCPAGTTGPDLNGDCHCASGTPCFRRTSRKCPTNLDEVDASGKVNIVFAEEKFSLGCKDCLCRKPICPWWTKLTTDGNCICESGYSCFQNGKAGCLDSKGNGPFERVFSSACSDCTCKRSCTIFGSLAGHRIGYEAASHGGECHCPLGMRCYQNWSSTGIGCPVASGMDDSAYVASCKTCTCEEAPRSVKPCPATAKRNVSDWDDECQCAFGSRCYENASTTTWGCPAEGGFRKRGKFTSKCTTCVCEKEPRSKKPCPPTAESNFSDWDDECNCEWPSRCYQNGSTTTFGCPTEGGSRHVRKFTPNCATCVCEKEPRSKKACPPTAVSNFSDWDDNCYCPGNAGCYQNISTTTVGCPDSFGHQASIIRFTPNCTSCMCEDKPRLQAQCPLTAENMFADWEGKCGCPWGTRCYPNGSATRVGCPSDDDETEFAVSCATCACESEPRVKTPCPPTAEYKFADFAGNCECPVDKRCYQNSSTTTSGCQTAGTGYRSYISDFSFAPCATCVCK